MGPYVGLNAILIGFFGFAAIYHLLLWWQSRRDAVLLAFAFTCTAAAVNTAALIGVATSQALAPAQRALDARLGAAVLFLAASAWLYSLVSGTRARGFVWGATAVALGLVVVHVMRPLTGTVTGVERMLTTWGEPLSSLRRESPSRWLVVAYALAATVDSFGLLCAARLWRRDRVGGALLGLASAGLLASTVWAILIDAAGLRGLYVGNIPVAVFVFLVAVQIARGYRQRGDQLVAEERRFRAIFDQTFQFAGLLSREGKLLEANRTALEFSGLRAEDVIGKPFWETPWWTHSPRLQEQLRQAIAAAANGEVVRFEATHRAADGRMHTFDCSVKPVRDERGDVVLLIPEGRDVTEHMALLHDLGERVKELTALHRTAIALQENRPFDQPLLRELVALLPPAWQYPEITEGRIGYAGLEAKTAGWCDSPWLQAQSFTTRDGLTGTLEVVYREERPPAAEGPFLVEERHLLQSLARMLTTHIDRQRAEQGMRMLSGRLVTAQEEERKRIARELHDEIGQVLTVVKMNLELLGKADRSATPQTGIEACVLNVDRAIEQVRELALDLRPVILDQLGLPAALRWFVDRLPPGRLATHLAVREVEGETLAPEVKTTAFRIAQEAVTNVLRHARARNVWLSLKARPSELELSVRDDGAGFDLGAMRRSPAASFGLSSMEERVRLVGGRLEIRTAPGAGTEVWARFPLAAERVAGDLAEAIPVVPEAPPSDS